MRALLVSSLAITLFALSGGCLGKSDPVASPDAGLDDGGASPLTACNDGTGDMNCCPPDTASQGACAPADLTCRTRCENGTYGNFTCSGNRWNAGHGLFPCAIEGGAGDEASSALEDCNDGTGLHDCCGEAVTSGAPCTASSTECWTRCTNGNRGQYSCSDGTWIAGKGLFPCGADAAP